MYKKIYYTGILSYLLLFVLSVLLYKERIIFADMAYHLFYIITGNNFTIQNYRFGAIVTQIFPLLSYRAGLSLNSIVLIYSLGFTCYYFICYLLAGFVFKNYQVAIAILLLNTLFVTHTFYWPESELPQGLAFLLVFLAYFLQQGRFVPLHISTCLLFSVVAVFFHPMIFMVMTYLVIFIILSKDIIVDKKLLITTCIFFIATYIFKTVFYATGYDTQAMRNSAHGIVNFLKSFPQSLHSHANWLFWHNCVGIYCWIPILYLSLIGYYISTKRWWLFNFFLIAIPAFILFINISYPNQDTRDFYRENMYLPLSLMIGIPFVYHLLPVLNKKKIGLIVVLAISIIGCARIYHNHDIYTNRLKWERNFLNQHPDQKIIMLKTQHLDDTLLMSWGSPFEFWLLSTTEQNKTASIIIADDISKEMWKASRRNEFATAWVMYPYNSLDKRYFKLTDSTSAYTIIK